MFITISHQANANQSYVELPSHLNQMTIIRKQTTNTSKAEDFYMAQGNVN